MDPKSVPGDRAGAAGGVHKGQGSSVWELEDKGPEDFWVGRTRSSVFWKDHHPGHCGQWSRAGDGSNTRGRRGERQRGGDPLGDVYTELTGVGGPEPGREQVGAEGG